MSAVGTLAAVVVGAVFVLAGAAKLAAGQQWPLQAAGLGAPRPVAVAVPWIELVTGASLAVGVAHPWPALIAIVLLVAFTLAIVGTLVAGRRPVCACFGTWSARPIGVPQLVRNTALLGVAVVALWR